MTVSRISITDLIRKKPFILIILSIMFGIIGASVDTIIDYLFYYEEDFADVLIPNLSSHEFYMRIMLVLTLTIFGLMVSFLLKHLFRFEDELKKTNEKLGKLVAQRTKEFKEIFTQSPYIKAILKPDFVIIDTNPAWAKMFNQSSNFFLNKKLLEISHFKDELISNLLFSVKSSLSPQKSDPLYFDELDKIIIIDVYPITDEDGNLSEIVINLEDITERLRRDEVDKELELQKGAMRTIFQFLEAERKRLAKELHDHIGQKLLLSKVYVELLKEKYTIDSKKFEEIIEILLNTNSEVREIVYSLHPAELENYGLKDAIQSRVNHCSEIGKYNVKIDFFGDYKGINKETELGVFRICQEALSNITKHAQASEVKLEFHMTNNLIIGIIHDNGIGFNTAEKSMKQSQGHSFGLISMRERARILNGNLEIESSSSNGTKIHFEIPIEENSNA
ncbi:ATP-binding protein [Bacteroidota bacterium]